MKKITDEQIAIISSNAPKPDTYSNFQYPYFKLDSRVFEVLVYSLFKRRIETNQFRNVFDNIDLMQGVGEKGMDSVLYYENEIKGLIQCKRYANNINVDMFFHELVKFCLNVIIDPHLIPDKSNFKYCFVTTKGYTGELIKIIQILNKGNIPKSINIEKFVVSIVAKTKSFHDIKYDNVKDKLLSILTSIKYEKIGPEELDLWISNFQDIEKLFFSIKSVIDNETVLKESKKIRRKISSLKQSKQRSYDAEIDKIIPLYYKLQLDKLSLVNFVGLGLNKNRHRPQEINLADLFVKPFFKKRENSKLDVGVQKLILPKGKDNIIADVFNTSKNIVILGEPGSGKSLLLKFIMHRILCKEANEIGLKEYSTFIPIRIELRKYNEIKDKNCIIDYLVLLFKTEYQINTSYEVLEYMFEKKDVLIFFDGFDEIFNYNHKATVKNNIESFLSRFPKSKGVVTSRFIGYHDNKFSDDKYDEFSILKLNEDKIKELVSNFCSTQYSNKEKRTQFINSFNEQLKEVDYELKSNPLILTLVLILMYNNISIPDSKLEIYESCTKTLVDTIDEQKELNIAISVDNKRRTFAHLAYWQYKAISSNQIVTNEKSMRSIANYLLEKNEAEDLPAAEEKAKSFLEYAMKRSIYFDDNFTHKTFLEYYTADYIYIKYFTKGTPAGRQELDRILKEYLKNPFWYIVFELLFLKIDKDQEDHEVLDVIFKKLLEQDAFNVMFFFISNIIKIQNISKDIRFEVIKKAGILCIEGKSIRKSNNIIFNDDDKSIINAFNMLSKSKIHLDLIQKFIDEIENDYVNYSEDFLIRFYIFIYELNSYDDSETVKIKIKNNEYVDKLCLKDVLLFSFHKLYENNVELNDLILQIENFGHNSIFENALFKYRPNYVRIPTYFRYLINIVEKQDLKKYKSDYYALSKHGLTLEKVIEYTKITNIYYFHNITKSFKNLIIMFVDSDDANIDKILFELISKQRSSKPAYEAIRKEISKAKIKQLDKIFNQPLTAPTPNSI